MIRFPVFPRLVLCVAALLASGFSLLEPTSIRTVQFADPDRGAIELKAFGQAKIRVTYSMPQHRGEYAFFTGDANRAEIAFVAAVGDFVSLDRDTRLEPMVDSWHFNITRKPVFGAEGNAVTGYSDYHYRHYRLGNEQACIAFSYDWEAPATDPNSKPGKLLFGYFCHAQRQYLSRKQISRFFDSLDVADAASRTARSLGDKKPGIDPAAMKAGQGDGKNWGNRDFPFAFGSEYDENTGDG